MTTIPETEFQKARAWRESLDLTWAELGQQIGYSRMAVYWFEAGCTPPVRGRRGVIKPWVWQRYKLACAGFAAQLAANRNFDWQ